MTIAQKSELKQKASELKTLLVKNRIHHFWGQNEAMARQCDRLLLTYSNALHGKSTINWKALEKFIDKAQWFFSCQSDLVYEALATAKDQQQMDNIAENARDE